MDAPISPPAEDLSSAALQTLHGEVTTLRQAMDRADLAIDELQVRTAEWHRPWYRNSQTLVAVFALLLSLLTTLTSAYWARTQGEIAEIRIRQQEIHDARTELRGLLQAMSSLTRQIQEVPVTGDADTTQVLLTSYASEVALLTNQAYEITEAIPGNVSSNEYLNVAVRMGELGDFQKADRLLQRAIATAQTPFDVLSAKRTYAIYLFSQGRFADGRDYLNQALTVWTLYTDAGQQAPPWYLVEDFVTRVRWAEAEVGAGNCPEANAQYENADALRGQLGLLPGTSLHQQFDRLTPYIAQCGLSELPAFPVQPDVSPWLPSTDFPVSDPSFALPSLTPFETPSAIDWSLIGVETPVATASTP